MIILEGFDNSGKTTLGKQLAELHGFDYIHSPGPLDRGFGMFNWALQEIAAQRMAIYDRLSPISDTIYAPIVRGQRSAYETHIEGILIRQLIAQRPHIVIYCRPSDEAIFRFGEREQMDGVKENAIKLLESYDEFFNGPKSMGLNFIRYDYENDSVDKVHQAVEKYFESRGEYKCSFL